MKNIIKNNYLYIILFVIFVITYIVFLGAYPLLDVDETRYVDIAKKMFLSGDYNTLYLNGNFFFEKPPLYFWIEILSFKIFGGVSEFAARIPIVLLSLLPVSLLFILSKKVKDIKFAFINCLVLMTTIEYVMITKIAILDSVLTSVVSSACLFYFFTFFVKEQNKKYFWALAYIFTGLAVLAKGIPGVAIPVATIFFCTIFFKTYKETFKNMPFGILLFLAITLPWHVLMLNKYNPLFFNEYVIKHHIMRFLGSDVIHRSRPFYYYILTLLWGLFPYITFLIFKLGKRIKDKNFKINLDKNIDYDKLLILNIIAICTIFLFFTSSKTKLITYIMPIYPFFATIIGNILYKYVSSEENNNYIKKGILTFNWILLLILLLVPIANIVALNLVPEYLKPFIIQIALTIGIIFVPYLLLAFKAYKNNQKLKQIILIGFLMAFLSCLGSPLAFKLDYAFGQNDLMKFAKQAKQNNYTISTYNTREKYSLLYYSDLKKVNFYEEEQESNWLANELKKPNNYVIMRDKEIKDLKTKVKILQKGIKYSIIGAE